MDKYLIVCTIKYLFEKYLGFPVLFLGTRLGPALGHLAPEAILEARL